MKTPLITCNNLNLRFKLHNFKAKTIKESIMDLWKKGSKNKNEYFSALKNVNFDLFKGDRLAIVGKNGSGKSTLLKTICKIYTPSFGHVIRNAQITPLLEAGAGFNMECTGRENIFLHGAINSIPRYEIKEKLDEIIDFAEVRKFIDTPVKYYSTGMFMRLAFSAATAFQPEILIIDELFIGGDYVFMEKGKKRIFELVDLSKAMVLVSHDHELLKELCNKFLWIEDGYIKEIGGFSVLENYLHSSL